MIHIMIEIRSILSLIFLSNRYKTGKKTLKNAEKLPPKTQILANTMAIDRMRKFAINGRALFFFSPLAI